MGKIDTLDPGVSEMNWTIRAAMLLCLGAICGIALVVACGGGPSLGAAQSGGGSNPPVGGSRLQVPALQVTRHTGSDGSAYFTSAGGDLPFYDTALGVYCSPQVTADGLNRCVPATEGPDPSVAARVAYNAYVGFADAGCTVPAVGVFTSVCRPKYVLGTVVPVPASGCAYPTGVVVYAVGAPISSFYSQQGGQCVNSIGYIAVAFSATTLPPSTFVAFTP